MNNASNKTDKIGDLSPLLFNLGAEIGSGKFSKVYLATKRTTTSGGKAASGEQFAVKVLDKKLLTDRDLAQVTREASILKQLDHPNVVKYYGSYMDGDKLCFVLEYCQGGELFSRIIEKEKYSEADAQRILRSVASALKYCHEKQIVHRDLKAENILLSTESDDDAEVKVADFGFAKEVIGNSTLSTSLGTTTYVAPEILTKQAYTAAVDMWAFGVLAYMLLCGYAPFIGNGDAETFRLIKSGQFSFDPDDWENLSSDAKDMIRHLLKLDPSKRLSAAQVLEHPWMKNSPKTEDMVYAINKLRKTLAKRKLKSGINAVVTINGLRSAAKKLGITKESSSLRKFKKPHSVHPLELDLVFVALIPLMSVVGLTMAVFYTAPQFETGAEFVPGFNVILGTSLLSYLFIFHTVRCAKLGLHHLGEILRKTEVAILLCGVGIATNRSFMVGTALCLAIPDEVCWLTDIIGYLLANRLPIGIAKTALSPTVSWIHKIVLTHHIFFIPVCVAWLLYRTQVIPGIFGAGFVVETILVLLARAFTPYSVREGAYSKDLFIWNINQAYALYEDIPFSVLHFVDHRPFYLYFPFMLLTSVFLFSATVNVLTFAFLHFFQGVPLFQWDEWDLSSYYL